MDDGFVIIRMEIHFLWKHVVNAGEHYPRNFREYEQCREFGNIGDGSNTFYLGIERSVSAEEFDFIDTAGEEIYVGFRKSVFDVFQIEE